MIIGVPKEIKEAENRVGLRPAGVEQLARAGHTVLIERGAGIGSSLEDADYENAGGTILEHAAEVFARAEMIVKVKEPQVEEFEYFRSGMILFTYLHLAAAGEVARALMEAEVTAIGYESVQTDEGRLPLLIPMSEVAGRMSVQEGAKYLESARGGKGILLGGVPGVRPGCVTILGGGTSGLNAAKVARGLGAEVNILDISLDRLRYLDDVLPGIHTMMYSPMALSQLLPRTDVLVGAVLLPGARAPHLVTRGMVQSMQRGSVIVDIAIDQGGCVETSRPTSHMDPIYIVDGVVHYCVTNMPGAVARTSTFALTNATFPYVEKIANLGFEGAIEADPSLWRGVNTYSGRLTNSEVAESIGEIPTSLESLLESNS